MLLIYIFIRTEVCINMYSKANLYTLLTLLGGQIVTWTKKIKKIKIKGNEYITTK